MLCRACVETEIELRSGLIYLPLFHANRLIILNVE